MASPSSRGDDAHDAHDASRNGPRHWNPYEMQAICALVCKGAHLKGSMSFATKLNKTLNGNGSYKDDIDIEDVEELLEHIETKKKAALAFVSCFPPPFVMAQSPLTGAFLDRASRSISYHKNPKARL